jgi:major membrane immunogen (membrane-anchored lipoprotein)
MSQQLSRRSALKIASGASLVAAWFVAGCANDDAIDTTIKTGEAKSLEESIDGKVGKTGQKAAPSPTQRLKTGRE